MADYFSDDTIFAFASALGGPVAILRLSGAKALAIAEKLSKKKIFTPRMAYKVSLYSDSVRKFDEALAIYFAAPKSFTGEECIEFHIHGSPFVCAELTKQLGKLGARRALPGEFSFRAVKNSKMNVNQAQAIAELIEARTDSAAEMALGKMSGKVNESIRRAGEELREILSLAELGIDFSDQDVEQTKLKNLKSRLKEVDGFLKNAIESYARGVRVQNGVCVSLVGPPNVGKSSFFNALLGEDRSIVTEVAGTTRDVVNESVVLPGEHSQIVVRLQDTAGVRRSRNKVEQLGIKKAQDSISQSDFVIAVVSVEMDEKSFLELKRTIGIEPDLWVINKADKVGGTQFAEQSVIGKLINAENRVIVSAMSGEGVGLAAKMMGRIAEKFVKRQPGEILITRAEHVKAIEQARVEMEPAFDADDEELFASDLRQVLDTLSLLIGETPADDILGRIFSGFCIGK